ncbi:MAG TPA: SUMF1/EgtB/PvdO family nonheme iron enzyme, partial [Spirochaetota bacterium]|nr:SUMF1/EgtB/PvdO family nonheme iron enzyme [Spirochaetota bacterium]
PEMIFIKGGSFYMGDPRGEDDNPRHQVELSSFYMSRHEITVNQFLLFLNEYGNRTVDGIPVVKLGRYFFIEKKDNSFQACSGCGDLPVTCVSWYAAYFYCKWLTEKTGRQYSLPTEAQWEYAAGGKNHTPYQDSRRIKRSTCNISGFKGYERRYCSYEMRVGGYQDNSPMLPAKLPPNSFGLYNMAGNVSEWVYDWYDPDFYYSRRQKDPVNSRRASVRCFRGGNFDKGAAFTDVRKRNFLKPSARPIWMGIRVVLTTE